MDAKENLLDLTLAAAKQDEETVRDGAPVTAMLDGLVFHETITHRDDRGNEEHQPKPCTHGALPPSGTTRRS